ncbi:MAG: sel1 repeat family protein [Alphaproteobacteria bacterium]|nr:sel1 repeat family protein [Alphaproteobacteria bacterium]
MMSKLHFSVRKQGIAPIAAMIAATAAIAVYAFYPTQMIHVMDPLVASDLKQARQFGKSGDWTSSATLIAPHVKGHNPQAKLEYALLQSRGWGVERNREQARQLLLQAVSYHFSGRGRAAFELGRLYKSASGDDCTRIALEWFIKAANWDYAKAHLELGAAYGRGLGTDPDLAKALKHYQIAAETGSAAAIWSMIELVQKGNSVTEPDLQSAKALAERYLPRLIDQAQGGNAYAARTLARLHLNGVVVAFNREKAGRWFTEAARLGDPVAMHDLAILLMESGQVSETGDTVLELMRESANRGYAGAITAMGRLHLQRKFGLSPPDAVDWFRQGVAAGHPGSMEELARLYIAGELVERNPLEARRLAAMGAKLHHQGAKRLLSEIDTKLDGAGGKIDALRLSKRG